MEILKSQTLPCFSCGKETSEGGWRDGCIFCSDCFHPSKEVPKVLISGIGPDSPTEVTKEGGKQSSTLYDFCQIPPEFLFALSALLKEGGDKYGKWNWKKVSEESNLNHALIHTFAHLAGDTQDEHLLHAACRIMFAWWLSNEEKEKVNEK